MDKILSCNSYESVEGTRREINVCINSIEYELLDLQKNNCL